MFTSDIVIFACKCRKHKEHKLTFDGGSSGQYQLLLCKDCYFSQDKKFFDFGEFPMMIIRVACKDHKKKTHRIIMEGSLLGRYGMWLCDDCYHELDNPDLLIDYDELEQQWMERDFRKFIENDT